MSQIATIDLGALEREPAIRGSVQSLYRLSIGERPYFISETSDAGSVFDVGTFFSIPGSGGARTALRHVVYTSLSSPEFWSTIDRDAVGDCFADEELVERYASSELLASLRQQGARTHHVGLVDPNSGSVHPEAVEELRSVLTLVEEYPVIRPHRFAFLGKPAWDYHEYQLAPRKLMALEHVFRRGCPGGSSLLQRYAAAESAGEKAVREFYATTGLKQPPEPWALFSDMVYDCATKFEDHDRHLTWQETVNLSGVSASRLEATVDLLTYCTIALNRILSLTNLTLWDVKWELAVSGDELIVVDTIDQDSIRLTGTREVDGRQVFFHFNKQAVRDYYRIVHSDWHAALNDAKAAAATDPDGRQFREVYDAGVASGAYPPIPEMDSRFADLQARKYELPLRPFGATQLSDDGEDLMQEELRLYDDFGRLEQLLAVNSADPAAVL